MAQLPVEHTVASILFMWSAEGRNSFFRSSIFFFSFFLSFDYHSGTREEWRKEVKKEGKRDIFFERILMKGGDELIRMLMD